VSKSGGKGRLSSELVAAGFAAVMTVYAAGYWRTREEAQRIDARAQERRPVQPVASPATSPATSPAAAVVQPQAALREEPLKSTPAQPAIKQSTAVAASPSLPATPAAPETITPQVAAAPPASKPLPDSPTVHGGDWRDGTYTGWGTSRHGDIKAQVVIRDGRIVDASIASCETRYPCDVIGDIIPQPVARQRPDVDRVSRATESADAYYFALVEALKEAQIPDEGQSPTTP